MLKRSTKTYLLCGIVALISGIIFCSIITFLIIGPIKNPNPPITPPNEDGGIYTPTLSVPTEITMGKLDQKRFIYSTTNLGEYQVSIYIENTSMALLDNNIIIPLRVGTTKIITSINPQPAIVKETILNVVESVSNVEFFITNDADLVPEIYFTNTGYILEIRQNTIPLDTPNISYENVENFTFIETTGTSIFFSFNVPNEKPFTFQYTSTHANLTKSYMAYNKPTTFNVCFSNVYVDNNTIKLYLFNIDYQQIANADGKYCCTNFILSSDNMAIDNIQLINYDNSILKIQNNNIIALSEGESILEFYSIVSGVSKTYNVEVRKINIDKLLINGTEKDIGSVDNIEIKQDDCYNFMFEGYPIYSYSKIGVSYNQSEIKYDNNKITIIDENLTKTVLTLTYENVVVYTLNIEINTPIEPVITHILLLDKKTGEVSLSEYNLTATVGSFAQLTITAYLNGNIIETQEYSLEVEDETLCKHLDDKVINGVINLEFLKEGKTQVDIFDKINNLHIILIVNINN